jgi:nitroreductase
VSVQKDQLPKFRTIAELIRSRRTIHDFQPQLPSPEIVLKGIELARWAPNHFLTEPWHFYLLGAETADAIARLNADMIARKKGQQAAETKLEKWRSIPGWIAVTCDKSDDPIRTREDYAACCCAIQNFSLYLWSEGVGVKWTTGAVIRNPDFYDLIWVDPELETVVGLLWYGYPAEVPQPPRKPVEQILVELP